MIGTSIGNYQIVSQIGEGGMGAVYLARHSTLGRRAAVKVLLSQLSNNRNQVARFFNEAKAATAVHHPGIVEVYDFGFMPDSSAYIIMEFLDGESLAARLHGTGRASADRALAWIRQIAGPLRAAHECGIVHRDLKPDNIFLVRDPDMPGGERVKLLDFGIAKLAADVGDASARTQTGAVMGTPTYMAPEQCRGAGQVDQRADLYALGCIMYEMLCGRPPFLAEGAGDVIAHHLYFAPQPPRQLAPGIPEVVEQLTLQLLEKDPQRRPQSAAELLSTIEQIVGSGGAASGSMLRAAVTGDRMAMRPPVTTLTSASGPVPMPAMTSAAGTRRRWLIPAVAGSVIAAGIIAVIAMSSVGGEREKTGDAPAASTPTPAAGPPPVERAPVEPPPAAPQPVAPQPVAPQPVAPPPVVLTIDSTPVGADVLLDGKLVGTTPFAERITPLAGSRTYTVRAKGYTARKVKLSTDASDHEYVELEKSKRSSTRRDPALGNEGVNPFD